MSWRKGDDKSVAHLDFWLGSLVADVVPGMGLVEQAADTPEFFSKLGDCLAVLKLSDLLTATSLTTLTNRMIYREFASFPIPKIAVDSPQDYKLIWKRLESPFIGAEVRDAMFLLIHDKLPVPERLFRIGVRLDPYCLHCPGAEVADLEHFFCSCVRTKQCWSWTRLKILGLCEQGLRSSNWELLNFVLPRTNWEQEICWLISTYVNYAWECCYVRDSGVVFEKFFGFLTFKYRTCVSWGQLAGILGWFV